MKRKNIIIGILALGILLIIITTINFSIGPSDTRLSFSIYDGFEMRETTPEEKAGFYIENIFVLIIGISSIVSVSVYYFYYRKLSERIDVVDDLIEENVEDDEEYEDFDPENDEYIKKLFKEHELN